MPRLLPAAVALALAFASVASGTASGAAIVGASPPENGTVATALTAAPASQADSADAGGFVQLSPARLVDSRIGLGTPTRLSAHGTARIQVAGLGGAPTTGISAAVVNLTVTNPTAAGYLTAWAGGTTPQPTTSNVNFLRGQTIPNLAVVPVNSDGTITIANGGPGTADFIDDIPGFFRPGSNPGGFGALSPARLVDSRIGLGTPTRLSAHGTARIQVAGLGGAPTTGISAAVVNLTVTNPTAAGYLTAWAGATTPQPTTSNVNFLRGQTIPNLAVVPVNSDGTITIANGGPGTADFIVDITGYFTLIPAPAALVWSPLEGVGPPPHGGVPSMSCRSWDFCMSVDTSGSARRWDGTAWSEAESVIPMDQLTGISCATTTFCMAIDYSGRAISYNGSRWSTPTVIAPNGELLMVSCGSAASCMAVDGSQNVYAYDGDSWAVSTVPHKDGIYPSSLACPSTTLCVLIDTEGKARTFDGSVWSGLTDALPLGGESALSCPTASTCVAAGGLYTNALVSGQWTGAQQIPVGGGVATCASLQFCIAFDGGRGTYSTYDGAAWSTPALVDQNANLPSPVASAACFPSATGNRCLGVSVWGLSYVFTTETGWSDGQTYNLVNAPIAVSCVSAEFCVAVTTQEGDALMFDGTSWRSTRVTREGGVRRGSQPGLNKISCAQTQFCVAIDTIDGVSSSFVYDGIRWSGPTPVGGEIADLSCPTTNFCMAVASMSSAFRFDGTSWTQSTSQLPSQLALSCTAPTFCLATSMSFSYAYDGQRWSGPSWVPGAESWLVFDAVSCTSSTFCIGNDSRGYSATFDGVHWKPVIRHPGSLQSVDCASPRMCVATSSSVLFSRVAQFDGTDWTQTAIDDDLRFVDVSCPTTDFCLAVNRSSVGAVGRPR